MEKGTFIYPSQNIFKNSQYKNNFRRNEFNSSFKMGFKMRLIELFYDCFFAKLHKFKASTILDQYVNLSNEQFHQKGEKFAQKHCIIELWQLFENVSRIHTNLLGIIPEELSIIPLVAKNGFLSIPRFDMSTV